jgi:hypothetical protein
MSRFTGRGVSLEKWKKLLAEDDTKMGENGDTDDDSNRATTIRKHQEKCKLSLKLIDTIVESLQERLVECNHVFTEMDIAVDELKEEEEERMYVDKNTNTDSVDVTDSDEEEEDDDVEAAAVVINKTVYVKYKEFKLQLQMASVANGFESLEWSSCEISDHYW